MTTPTISSPSTALKSKIEGRQAKVGVIGMGYVGLPLALLYTEQKFQVTGFDIDQRKVDTLNSGGSYIFRITPAEIQAARSGGHRYGHSDYDYHKIVKEAQLVDSRNATKGIEDPKIVRG